MKPLLLRYIRRAPRSTQQCRAQFKEASSMEVEALLEELRDEGEIAFANGQWYVLESTVHSKPRKAGPVHPKQLPLFPDAQGRRLTGHEQLVERIGDIARAVRRR